MARTKQKRNSIKVPLSRQSRALLDQLAATGLYGLNPEEVAQRFIDSALQQHVRPLRLKIPKVRKRKRR